MKNKRPIPNYPQKIQGFSLIEFLIASALSMIVLMAITSTYFTARNLNSSATSRLSVQQDLRNASTLLVRDARMAGSFGCFNMANHAKVAVISDGSNAPFDLAGNPGKDSMIPIREAAISYSGFTPTGSALIFQYGINDNNPGTSPVASSCNSIAKSSAIKGSSDFAGAKNALKISENGQNGTISILKHVVAAYAVGEIQGQKGLYRFQLDNNNWGDPQLLIKGINSMTMNYLYVDDCPDGVSAASGAKSETFAPQAGLRTGADAITPALIQIRLNGGGTIDASSNDNKVQVYNIDAAVRGGNVCADRSI